MPHTNHCGDEGTATPQGRAGGAHQDTQRAVSWARGSAAGAPVDGSARLGADPSGCTHLLAWAAGCSAPRWKGKRNSSLLPRLPELTRMTLMGLVLSPMPAQHGSARPGPQEGGTARLISASEAAAAFPGSWSPRWGGAAPLRGRQSSAARHGAARHRQRSQPCPQHSPAPHA